MAQENFPLMEATHMLSEKMNLPLTERMITGQPHAADLVHEFFERDVPYDFVNGLGSLSSRITIQKILRTIKSPERFLYLHGANGEKLESLAVQTPDRGVYVKWNLTKGIGDLYFVEQDTIKPFAYLHHGTGDARFWKIPYAHTEFEELARLPSTVYELLGID